MQESGFDVAANDVVSLARLGAYHARIGQILPRRLHLPLEAKRDEGLVQSEKLRKGVGESQCGDVVRPCAHVLLQRSDIGRFLVERSPLSI